jgi:transmembrane sensor
MAHEPRDPSPAIEPELWEALARYVSGESPQAEADTIRKWIEDDPARGELLLSLDAAAGRLAAAPQEDVDVEAALSRVHQRMAEPEVVPFRARQEHTPPARRTTGLRSAAAVLLLLAAALIWRTTQSRVDETAAPAARTFSTAPGETDSLRLADGTLVVLGPASELTVQAEYNENVRDVNLTGEALFDVVHDAGRPFTVHAATASIQDLGTSFTVRTDAAEEVRVVVTAGSVLLHAAGEPPESGVILRAGDRGVLSAGGNAIAERSAPTDADLAWTRGHLVFADAPLDRVAEDLRRWYGIQLRIADPALASRHITATFAGEPVQKVLDVIALALGARVEMRGDTAIISR